MLRTTATLALLITGHAAAQRPVVMPAQSNVPSQAPHLVDQSVADVNSLSASQRVLRPDQREPTGFLDVMEVPGRPDLLMRANGRVYAVFPRSEYVAVRGGIMPVIPANTIFYIGEPPSAESIGRAFTASMNERSTRESNVVMASRRQGQVSSTETNHRTTNQPDTRNNEPPPPSVTDPDAPDTHKIYDLVGPVTIVTDHSYRLWRLQELMLRAARAEQANAEKSDDPTHAPH